LLNENLEQLQSPDRQDGDILGISTGFKQLDNRLLGMQPGQLIIIAARPGIGKTSLALNIALNSSAIHDMAVVIFSLEMMGSELSLRIISQQTTIPNENLKKISLDKYDLEKIKKSFSQIGRNNKNKIFINDDSYQNVFDIQSECRRIKNEVGNLGLIVIDYIQLMRSQNRENREQQIAEISRSLKLLAKDLGCPIIVLSQLNRSAESRDNKRPSLSDLRESGALEQDADIVLLIYRDEFYFPETTKEKGIAVINIAKNRSGEMGIIKNLFI
jgi:replicative DNA helicase